ncbi:MAG TPA: hypothetical protein VNH83_28365 [Bryobacteraceae bacterium]|nr:hypothetical protein [Bryobacteraceae bacterium]
MTWLGICVAQYAKRNARGKVLLLDALFAEAHYHYLRISRK